MPVLPAAWLPVRVLRGEVTQKVAGSRSEGMVVPGRVPRPDTALNQTPGQCQDTEVVSECVVLLPAVLEEVAVAEGVVGHVVTHRHAVGPMHRHTPLVPHTQP